MQTAIANTSKPLINTPLLLSFWLRGLEVILVLNMLRFDIQKTLLHGFVVVLIILVIKLNEF